MPAPLDDITIYYWGQKIKTTPEDWEFARTENYISDFYHKMMFGYKPPKTSRICIHINNYKTWEEPDYNGSICRVANVIDEEKYLSLSKKEQYKYILEIIHSSCMDCASFFKWNEEVFIKAYNEVYRRDFSFYLDYPVKKSKDRKSTAHVQVVKTENLSILYLIFLLEDKYKRVKLLEKTNWFWYDSIYEMAKNSKWTNNSTFGVYSKRNNKFGYYSLTDEVIVGELDFSETVF